MRKPCVDSSYLVQLAACAWSWTIAFGIFQEMKVLKSVRWNKYLSITSLEDKIKRGKSFSADGIGKGWSEARSWSQPQPAEQYHWKGDNSELRARRLCINATALRKWLEKREVGRSFTKFGYTGSGCERCSEMRSQTHEHINMQRNLDTIKYFYINPQGQLQKKTRFFSFFHAINFYWFKKKPFALREIVLSHAKRLWSSSSYPVSKGPMILLKKGSNGMRVKEKIVKQHANSS